MSEVYLHIPQFEELNYRSKILSDPDTMKYNAHYNLGFEGYDDETGCIKFPESEWRQWFNAFMGREERFYAYIAVADVGFVGEVNLRKIGNGNCYGMGIVIEANHRGKGYAKQALKLLLRQAFEAMGADTVVNEFEDTRVAAVKAHLNVGFKPSGRGGITEYKITRADYTANI